MRYLFCALLVAGCGNVTTSEQATHGAGPPPAPTLLSVCFDRWVQTYRLTWTPTDHLVGVGCSEVQGAVQPSWDGGAPAVVYPPVEEVTINSATVKTPFVGPRYHFALFAYTGPHGESESRSPFGNSLTADPRTAPCP